MKSSILCPGNHDRKCHLWNIVSIVRYIPNMQTLLKCCYIERESLQLGKRNNVCCNKILFSTYPNCQCLNGSQYMRQTYISLCSHVQCSCHHPLFFQNVMIVILCTWLDFFFALITSISKFFFLFLTVTIVIVLIFYILFQNFLIWIL